MKLTIAGLEFEPLIKADAIQERVTQLAAQINNDYADMDPIFIGVLNGSFLFIADMVKQIVVPCEITFTKLASYFGGTQTTRKIREDIELSVDIKGRHIIIVEDIVDSGNTIAYLINKLQIHQPASVAVCALLLKPAALEHTINELKYVAFEVENHFVVGYGMDYQEWGRNLNGIYRKV
ncbi:hypoxanthine phosphoribosyltransferase [soil metagenome]|jgi:hypoxanthine phosphoribosyltransferase